ncbi:MAG: hypothetical protein ACRCZI_00935 [Cetobacterium sp.]
MLEQLVARALARAVVRAVVRAVRAGPSVAKDASKWGYNTKSSSYILSTSKLISFRVLLSFQTSSPIPT